MDKNKNKKVTPKAKTNTAKNKGNSAPKPKTDKIAATKSKTASPLKKIPRAKATSAVRKSALKKTSQKPNTKKVFPEKIIPSISKSANKKNALKKPASKPATKKPASIAAGKPIAKKLPSPPIKTPPKKFHGENLLKIYLVVKVAIYNHDIFGAYRNLQEAIEAANNLAFNEIGGHHTFDVVEVPLNFLKAISYNDTYGQSCKQTTLFSAFKKLDSPGNESMLWGEDTKS